MKAVLNRHTGCKMFKKWLNMEKCDENGIKSCPKHGEMCKSHAQNVESIHFEMFLHGITKSY